MFRTAPPPPPLRPPSAPAPADGYIGPANGTVPSPECRGLDPQVSPRDASEPAESQIKTGLGLSGPAPLELGWSGGRQVVISAPRYPAARHERRKGPESPDSGGNGRQLVSCVCVSSYPSARPVPSWIVESGGHVAPARRSQPGPRLSWTSWDRSTPCSLNLHG